MGTGTILGAVTAFLMVVGTVLKLVMTRKADERTKADAITERDITELERGMAVVDGVPAEPVPTRSETRV